MEWYIKVLKDYAVFDGRASRQEYWMFVLFHIIVSFAIGVIAGILSAITKSDQTILGNIYSLATLIPTLAVGSRRMHDIDRSGWWQIVPIAGLVFSIQEGTKGSNKFGADPVAKSR